MRLLTGIFTIFLTVVTFYSQNFKEVKSSQDLVDNYLTACGGADLLKDVESVSMKGNMGDSVSTGTIELYFSSKYVYINITGDMFSMKQAIDLKKKKGWVMFGTMLKDLSEEDISRNSKNAAGALWSNYLEPVKNGITFELLQNEDSDGKETYVLDLIREGNTVSTAYFDTKTFLKVQEIKGSMANTFSDFREVGSTGIIMPYSIKSPQGNVKLTEIKFNTKFNKKLLRKPETDNKESNDIKSEDKEKEDK